MQGSLDAGLGTYRCWLRTVLLEFGLVVSILVTSHFSKSLKKQVFLTQFHFLTALPHLSVSLPGVISGCAPPRSWETLCPHWAAAVDGWS